MKAKDCRHYINKREKTKPNLYEKMKGINGGNVFIDGIFQRECDGNGCFISDYSDIKT